MNKHKIRGEADDERGEQTGKPIEPVTHFRIGFTDVIVPEKNNNDIHTHMCNFNPGRNGKMFSNDGRLMKQRRGNIISMHPFHFCFSCAQVKR